MMMTGSAGSRALTLASSSSPEPPGMRMSDTSTCGVSSSRAASMSRALLKLRTGSPSRARAFSSTKRIEWSSSTTQMDFIRFLGRAGGLVTSGQWQCDSEVRQARLALAIDHALVLLGDRLRERESEARAAIPPGDQGEEDAIPDLGGDAGTVVLDMQFQCQAPALLADRDLPGHAGAQHDLGVARRNARRQHLRRVLHDVEHHLDQLLAVTAEVGQRGVVVARDREALGMFDQHQRAHALADFMDVDVTH